MLPPEPPTPLHAYAVLPPEPPTPPPGSGPSLPPEPPTPPPQRMSDIPAPRSSGIAPPLTRRPTRPPLLASEALMEDLAPVEPLGQRARALCVVAGLLFALFGALPLLGIELTKRPALVPSLVVGAVTVFAAIVRVSYRKRAIAMIALGAIVAGLGIAGTGPAQGVAEGGALWSLVRWVAAAALPATILFRARYRAFKGARLLLGLAFVASLPFAIHAIGLLVETNGFGFVQVGALLALAFLVAGLPGFMGSETTAAGSFVAPALIVALALQAGLQRLGALVPGSLSDVFTVLEVTDDGGATQTVPVIALSAADLWDAVVTSIALAGSALLSALGLFQVMAWRFAPAARRIDVRRIVERDVEERSSIEDWSTRA